MWLKNYQCKRAEMKPEQKSRLDLRECPQMPNKRDKEDAQLPAKQDVASVT